MHLRCAWKGITGLGPSKTQRVGPRSSVFVGRGSRIGISPGQQPASHQLRYLSSARLKAYAGSWGSNLLKWAKAYCRQYHVRVGDFALTPRPRGSVSKKAFSKDSKSAPVTRYTGIAISYVAVGLRIALPLDGIVALPCCVWLRWWCSCEDVLPASSRAIPRSRSPHQPALFVRSCRSPLSQPQGVDARWPPSLQATR